MSTVGPLLFWILIHYYLLPVIGMNDPDGLILTTGFAPIVGLFTDGLAGFEFCKMGKWVGRCTFTIKAYCAWG